MRIQFMMSGRQFQPNFSILTRNYYVLAKLNESLMSRKMPRNEMSKLEDVWYVACV